MPATPQPAATPAADLVTIDRATLVSTLRVSLAAQAPSIVEAYTGRPPASPDAMPSRLREAVARDIEAKLDAMARNMAQAVLADVEQPTPRPHLVAGALRLTGETFAVLRRLSIRGEIDTMALYDLAHVRNGRAEMIRESVTRRGNAAAAAEYVAELVRVVDDDLADEQICDLRVLAFLNACAAKAGAK